MVKELLLACCPNCLKLPLTHSTRVVSRLLQTWTNHLKWHPFIFSPIRATTGWFLYNQSKFYPSLELHTPILVGISMPGVLKLLFLCCPGPNIPPHKTSISNCFLIITVVTFILVLYQEDWDRFKDFSNSCFMQIVWHHGKQSGCFSRRRRTCYNALP